MRGGEGIIGIATLLAGHGTVNGEEGGRPGFVGALNMCHSAEDDLLRQLDDKLPISLLQCRSKDESGPNTPCAARLLMCLLARKGHLPYNTGS